MKRFALHMALPTALSLFLASCGGGDQPAEPVEPTLRTSVYRSLTTVDFVKDTRIRESAPNQTQGTFSTIKFGAEPTGYLNLLIMDTSVVFQDSIPQTSEIIACTLWVKINQMPLQNGDSVIVDLWSVTESWNENDASWTKRTSTQAWNTPGGAGALIAQKILLARRIDNFSFEWWINGELYDTVTVEAAPHIPIPLDTALARQNLTGNSFGFSLRNSAQTTPGALFGLVTSEAPANQNRPYFLWVYRQR